MIVPWFLPWDLFLFGVWGLAFVVVTSRELRCPPIELNTRNKNNQPQTPNPKPQTPNPNPQTKNPKPQTKKEAPVLPEATYYTSTLAYYARSNLSRFITLVQAATKSFTNFSLPSLLAYTSAIALSSELEPNTRSARVAVHLAAPVLRSLPS
jgi:hypothetical protein